MNEGRVTEVEEIMRGGGGEWRCEACGKLLGMVKGKRVHIRIARRQEYIVSGPASAVCRGCGQLNELTVRERTEGSS